MKVVVNRGDVDYALGIFKKKLQRESLPRKCKEIRYYQKPSEKRAIKKAESERRRRKLEIKKNKEGELDIKKEK